VEAVAVPTEGVAADVLIEEIEEAAMVAASIEGVLTEVLGRCTRPPAQNAAMNAKCRSSRQKENLCIAGNALPSAGLEGSETDYLNRTEKPARLVGAYFHFGI
jgi:hypothetical protein